MLFDLVVYILHLYSYIRFEKRQWILKETMKILSRCILMNLILAGMVKEGVRESDLYIIYDALLLCVWILIDYVSDIILLCHSVLHFMFCYFCISCHDYILYCVSSFLCDSIYVFTFIFCS